MRAPAPHGGRKTDRLRRVLHGKFVAGLKSAFQHDQLYFSGDLALLAQPKIFASWLRPLFRKDWVVYSKPPFGRPEYVLQYLGRYTHRVAVSTIDSSHWLMARSPFRWRDSTHNNQQRLMTVSLDEFLRRFLLHLLPRGFVRVRHFGFLASCRRSTLLPLCFATLGTVPSQIEPETSAQESDPLWRCPKCGGPIEVIETTYRCLTSTPLSTTVGHYHHMKRLTHNAKTLHGSPRAVPVASLLTRSPLRVLSYIVFDHRFSL
jgi:Putative transposase